LGAVIATAVIATAVIATIAVAATRVIASTISIIATVIGMTFGLLRLAVL
jgi:hypothetical protein